jgi:hypothetical protein
MKKTDAGGKLYEKKELIRKSGESIVYPLIVVES